jgi:hypothetical protein
MTIYEDELTLKEKQRLFRKCWRVLLAFADLKGYDVIYGMFWRSRHESDRLKEAGIGISPSLHEYCLAGHLEAFKDGEYMTTTEEYLELGEFWESLDILCAWGGRFGDGIHFSIRHDGMQ